MNKTQRYTECQSHGNLLIEKHSIIAHKPYKKRQLVVQEILSTVLNIKFIDL